MWKLIFLAVALYIAYKLFANDFLKKGKAEEKEEKEERDRKITAGEMVKDPECGAYVSVDDSISVKDGDRVFYFCSYECRDNFLKRLEAGGRDLPRRDEE